CQEMAGRRWREGPIGRRSRLALGVGDSGRVPYLADRCLGRLGEWLENVVLIQQLSVPLRLRSESLRAGDDEEPSLSTRGRIEVGSRRELVGAIRRQSSKARRGFPDVLVAPSSEDSTTRGEIQT